MLPPFFANLFTFVFAFDSTNMSPFVTTVTTLLVVAYAVIDRRERDVRWLVAFVLAIETR